jgi:sulfopyruvate decarboxylase subunit alpha
MVMSYRGDLGENKWWAVPHGMTMEPLLNAMAIPYRVIDEEARVAAAIRDAFTWSYASYYHSAVALTGDLVR